MIPEHWPFLSRYAPESIAVESDKVGEAIPVYKLPDLETCRKGWERFIGHPIEWAQLN